MDVGFTCCEKYLRFRFVNTASTSAVVQCMLDSIARHAASRSKSYSSNGADDITHNTPAQPCNTSAHTLTHRTAQNTPTQLTCTGGPRCHNELLTAQECDRVHPSAVKNHARCDLVFRSVPYKHESYALMPHSLPSSQKALQGFFLCPPTSSADIAVKMH